MRRVFWLLVALTFLPACGRGTATTAAPTRPPATAAVQPTITLPPKTSVSPTQTIGNTPPISAATGPAAATASPSASDSTAAPPGPFTDQAEFVADVTVPDSSDFAPGAKFTKTWRIKNVGTATWTTGYAMEYVRGTNMAAVSTVSFPTDAPPGGTVELSVEMTAPATPGQYTSLWQFSNAAGVKFGVGPNFNEPIYVLIDVVAGANPGTQPAIVPTTAATPSGPVNPAKVTKVTISVDNATVKDSCPHTFVFTAIFVVEGGGLVTYQLEASTDTPGFNFVLPSALNSTFNGNGPHTFGVSYNLEIRDTVNAQAWLHILSPNDLVSDKAAFSLTCPPKATLPPPFTPTAPVTPTEPPEP